MSATIGPVTSSGILLSMHTFGALTSTCAHLCRTTSTCRFVEESFTSEHWIVRIYRVLKPHEGRFNRDGRLMDEIRPHEDAFGRRGGAVHRPRKRAPLWGAK